MVESTRSGDDSDTRILSMQDADRSRLTALYPALAALGAAERDEVLDWAEERYAALLDRLSR